MDLSTTQQVLLVILASALSIFIILAIVVAIMVIRLLIVIKLVTSKAEHLIESAEAVGQVFKKASGPAGILSIVKGAFEFVQEHKKRK